MPSDHEKIVHEIAVVKQGLGAHAGLARNQVAGVNLRDESLETPHKSGLADGAIDLLHPFGEIPAGKLPETTEGDDFAKIAQVEICLLIALSFQSQDRIRSGVD